MPLFSLARTIALLIPATFLWPFQATLTGPQNDRCFVTATHANGNTPAMQYLNNAIPYMVTFPAPNSFTWTGAVVFTGAPHARGNSPLVTAFPALSEFHSYYIGEDAKIYDVYLRGVWQGSCLSNTTLCNRTSALAAGSFQTDPLNPTPNLFYISPVNQVGFLQYDGHNWSGISFNFGRTPRGGTPLLTANLNNNNQETHVFYVGDDNLVYDFYLRGGEWQTGCLNLGGTPCRNTTSLVGSYNSNGYHLYYMGTDNKIYNLYLSGNNWVPGCLDNAMEASPASTIGIEPYSGELIYQDAADNLHLLNYANNNWNDATVILPTQDLPDDGTPLGVCGNYAFFKKNGNMMQIKIATQ